MEKFCGMPLFYNLNFFVDHRPVFYKESYRKGIRYVYDIFYADRYFITRHELDGKYGTHKFLTF